MISRNDVDSAEMSISAPLLLLFRQNYGAEIDVLAMSTSFRHGAEIDISTFRFVSFRFDVFSTNHFSLGSHLLLKGHAVRGQAPAIALAAVMPNMWRQHLGDKHTGAERAASQPAY